MYKNSLQFNSDLLTNHGCYRAIKSRLSHGGTGKTYVYRFDGDTELNVFKRVNQKKGDIQGAAHSDDLFHMFKTKFAKAPAIESKEFALIKTMINLWTSFAIDGIPCYSGWQPAVQTQDAPKCLNISNDTLQMGELPDFDRLRVWNEIYVEAGVELI